MCRLLESLCKIIRDLRIRMVRLVGSLALKVNRVEKLVESYWD